MPEYSPQLATLVKTPPQGDEWLHEIKFDGYRIGCRVRNGRTTLYSRNGNDWTAAFPEIAAAASKLPVDDAFLDGEVASLLPDGRTSFQLLQNAARDSSKGTIVYFVFDLLRLDGERIAALPLEERKARLQQIVGRRKKGRIRYSDHVDGRGDTFFAHACRMRLEGIISKRRDLPYKGGRHGGWLKTKCVLRQEFVIGGFTDPDGARVGLGALLIGHYAGAPGGRKQLVFAGKVGTGFTQRSAIELRASLDRIVRSESPFTPEPPRAVARAAHWVKPQLVCEVEFTEWTDEDRIRHPSFQGLRKDKRPHEVVRERPRSPG